VRGSTGQWGKGARAIRRCGEPNLGLMVQRCSPTCQRGGGAGGGPGRPAHSGRGRRSAPLCSGWRSLAWLVEEDLRTAALVAVGTSAWLTLMAPGGREWRNGALWCRG
jgi:hypothetical protein